MTQERERDAKARPDDEPDNAAERNPSVIGFEVALGLIDHGNQGRVSHCSQTHILQVLCECGVDRLFELHAARKTIVFEAERWRRLPARVPLEPALEVLLRR